MRGLKLNFRCATFVMGLQEATCTKTPVIAGLKTREVEFGARSAEVIANIFGVGQEFGRHRRTNRVAALIFVACVAGPVAEKSGQRIARAGREHAAQYIDAVLLLHEGIIQALRYFAKHFYIIFADIRLTEKAYAICSGPISIL